MSDETLGTQSRRSFLRLSSYLTGGLVLPLAGTKALAISNPAQAESVAVRPVAMPVSRELSLFRAAARGYNALRRKIYTEWGSHLARFGCEAAIVDKLIKPEGDVVAAKALAVIARPVETWADVGALAEIAWLYAPRDDCPVGPHSRELKRGHWRRRPDDAWGFDHEEDPRLSANAALIEGVLKMTNGQRFDMYDVPPI